MESNHPKRVLRTLAFSPLGYRAMFISRQPEGDRQLQLVPPTQSQLIPCLATCVFSSNRRASLYVQRAWSNDASSFERAAKCVSLCLHRLP
jgi:hypothetical protein